MKRNLLLAAVLAALTSTAYATDRGSDDKQGQPQANAVAGSLAIAGAAALSSSGAVGYGGNSSASIGGNSINVQGDTNDRIIPASSAVAPSVTSNTICPIISPSSHAVQFLVFGGSTTGSSTINTICVAYHMEQWAVVERMACNKDAEYRKANPNCAAK
jgi:hypothetical protein